MVSTDLEGGRPETSFDGVGPGCAVRDCLQQCETVYNWVTMNY
jgi:hypothetical protein